MKRFISSLFGRYADYHNHGPELLKYAGFVGIFAYPLFYLLRYTKASVPFDDWPLRALGVVLCLGLAVKDWWPERLRRHYIAYSYWVMLYCLPTFFVATSLINGGGTIAVANTLMAVFFLILLSDWRNTVVLMVSGIAMGAGLHAWLVPEPEWPMDYIARLPIAVLVVIGGSLFKFAEKRAEADKLRRTYTALAGSIAHEVRNPLGQVRMALDNIEQALPAPTGEDGVRTLQPARVDDLYRHLSAGQLAVQRGLQVISLTLGQVRSRTLDPSAFVFVEVGATTRRAVEEYGYDSALQRGRVQMEVKSDFVFRGDETAYFVILFNLIRNALYYFEAHPLARLTITVDAPRVLVRDTGPGMSQEALRHLFEPFSTSGKSDGTGLGLSYCRRAMRAFGGDISCESEHGRFTEFALTFVPAPAGEVRADIERQLTEAGAGLAGRRVMVVDDDTLLRQSTTRMLRLLGCDAIEAEGGAAALTLLHGVPCDAMLLDLKMPGLDGFEVAARLRAGAVPGCEGLPIVALTSEPPHIVLPRTRKVGMNGFISKPGTPLALATALREALRPVVRSAQPLAGRTVLLAEDSTYSRSVMRAQLQQWGAQVIEAWSGESALDHVLEQQDGGPRLDAVVMDLNMPGQGGLDATRAIRALPEEWGRVPVLALTGHSDDETIASALAAGVDDYLVKPVDPGALLQHLMRRLDAWDHRPPPAALAGAPTLVPPIAPTASLVPPLPLSPITMRAPVVDVPQAVPAAAVEVVIDPERLLDPARLEQLRSVDMIEEGLPLYLSQMHAQLDRLDEAHREKDFQKARDALHSLVGASGDSGATALHQASRAIYPLLVEQRWPEDETWLPRLRALARATDEAMHERYLRNPPGSAPR